MTKAAPRVRPVAPGAEGRNRTGTGGNPRQILSLLRLPVPPPRRGKNTTSGAELSNRGGPITIAVTQKLVDSGRNVSWNIET